MLPNPGMGCMGQNGYGTAGEGSPVPHPTGAAGEGTAWAHPLPACFEASILPRPCSSQIPLWQSSSMNWKQLRKQILQKAEHSDLLP